MAGLGVFPLVDMCIWYVHFLLSHSPNYLYLNKGHIRMTLGNASMNILFQFCDF